MTNHTVEYTKDSGLCCSCGICKSVCPRACIEYRRQDGMFYPVIDSQRCIQCGICYDVCPGLKHEYTSPEPVQAMTGESLRSYNAWSRDEQIRFVSASGGCVSSIVISLLHSHQYDYATTLDTYDYHHQLESVLISAKDTEQDYSQTAYPKSRYLPVSHEKTVRFILDQKDKRIIFIGTSCAVRGLLNVIDRFHLNRDQYLIIGLFCDKVFNYNIQNCYAYKAQETENRDLSFFHFKNKESGGWPGNMKWFFSDGSFQYVDATERTNLKAYFMPERCLYCIDKLNVEADISIGDNFTDKDSTVQGSNSVIIRTKRGEDAWRLAQERICARDIPLASIVSAQVLEKRAENACYAQIKENAINRQRINDGIVLPDLQPTYDKPYQLSIQKITLGKSFDRNPQQMMCRIRKMQKQESRVPIMRRLKSALRKLLSQVVSSGK